MFRFTYAVCARTFEATGFSFAIQNTPIWKNIAYCDNPALNLRYQIFKPFCIATYISYYIQFVPVLLATLITAIRILVWIRKNTKNGRQSIWYKKLRLLAAVMKQKLQKTRTSKSTLVRLQSMPDLVTTQQSSSMHSIVFFRNFARYIIMEC